VKRYLSDMFMHWLVNHEPAPTLDDLLENQLAAQLEKKYKG